MYGLSADENKAIHTACASRCFAAKSSQYSGAATFIFNGYLVDKRGLPSCRAKNRLTLQMGGEAGIGNRKGGSVCSADAVSRTGVIDPLWKKAITVARDRRETRRTATHFGLEHRGATCGSDLKQEGDDGYAL